jgi:hypothetical protein
VSDRKQLVREFYENRLEEEGCGKKHQMTTITETPEASVIALTFNIMPDKRIGRVELVTTRHLEKLKFPSE